MRFFDVTSGSIEIDGVDLRDMSMESLRQNVGIVLQESFLFSGTVEDNIKYGCEHAMHAQVVEAAKTIVDYCKQQGGCQNCIFRSFGCDHWNCAIGAFEIRDVLSNIEAKKRNHGYL